jgi:hypothetical protein
MISLTIARNPDGSEKPANAFAAGDSEFAETGLTPIPSA